MQKQKLRNLLQLKNVPDYYYNLDNVGEIDQKVCLEFDGESWIVYYSERGKMFDLVKYQTEDEACRDILSRLVK